MQEKTTVDGSLEQQEGGWTFDEEVAEEFDSHVRKSIPMYDQVQTQVVDLADWFLQSEGDEYVYDLGCATGTTIERLVERFGSEGPPSFVGIDLQAPMLRRARERVGHHSNVDFLQADVSSHTSFPSASLVISLFTMSFVREADRRRLVERIYEDLEYGGAFVFAEKTRARSARFQDIWNEEYWDFKAEQGLSEEEILGKAKTLRGQLRPLSVAEYEGLLADAGFDIERDVDVFFKWFPWTGFVARKR
jgi:tRNA (cmo5U34)-methyltransferase